MLLDYYRRLKDGVGRSEALREAQLALMARGGRMMHPYWWAGFVVVGDDRSLDGREEGPVEEGRVVQARERARAEQAERAAKVAGQRGCGCRAAGGDDDRGGSAALMALAFGLGVARRRGRSPLAPTGARNRVRRAAVIEKRRLRKWTP